MNIKTEVERSLTKLLLSTVFCRNGAEEKVIPAHFACAAFVKHVRNRERKINGTEWGGWSGAGTIDDGWLRNWEWVQFLES
jgi:hypothetical protein